MNSKIILNPADFDKLKDIRQLLKDNGIDMISSDLIENGTAVAIGEKAYALAKHLEEDKDE